MLNKLLLKVPVEIHQRKKKAENTSLDMINLNDSFNTSPLSFINQ